MKRKIPKVGDIIVLDCGYRAHSDDQPCKILEVKETFGLFGDEIYQMKVQMPNGEIFMSDLGKEFVETE